MRQTVAFRGYRNPAWCPIHKWAAKVGERVNGTIRCRRMATNGGKVWLCGLKLLWKPRPGRKP